MNEKLEIWKQRFVEAEAEYSARLANLAKWLDKHFANSHAHVA